MNQKKNSSKAKMDNTNNCNYKEDVIEYAKKYGKNIVVEIGTRRVDSDAINFKTDDVVIYARDIKRGRVIIQELQDMISDRKLSIRLYLKVKYKNSKFNNFHSEQPDSTNHTCYGNQMTDNYDGTITPTDTHKFNKIDTYGRPGTEGGHGRQCKDINCERKN